MLQKLFRNNLRYTSGIGVIVLSLFLIGYISDPEPVTGVDVVEEVIEEEPMDTVPPNFYVANGIVSDSLMLFEGAIKKNQSLSEILLRYNVSYGLIDQVAKKSKDV
ncbi:MAG: hypothetical protein JKY52_13835, partial [Flavobacteriales bacterium]|nr:hypothetical protein [Flavobacteriales bacterium]